MWNFEDYLSAKGIIFRYTSKPETGYLFYNLLINFFISNMLGEKEKQKQVVSARANDANKHIDWLIFFIIIIETVIGPGLDRLSCQKNSRNAPEIKTRKKERF